MSTMRNSVMLIGRPTADAVKINEDGTMFFELSVREWVGNDFETFTIGCVCKSDHAIKLAQQVKKDKQVAIEGRLRVLGKVDIVVNDLFIIDK